METRHAGMHAIYTSTCTSWVFAVILLPACLLSSCLCSTGGVNRGDINLISLEQEWQIGGQLEQELARELLLIKDTEAHAYLQQLGERIVAQTELADQPWTFHLVADPTVNAFAVPGGHIYVHTGLVEAADNVAELAGVMAHEVAHGVARHSTERLTKVYGLNKLLQLLMGEDPGLLEQIAAQLVGSGVVAKFSRSDEREADRFGLEYLYEASYNPEGMASMFEKLLAQRQRRPNALERFFASHPLTEERIEHMRQEAKQMPANDQLISQDQGFQRFKQQISREGV